MTNNDKDFKTDYRTITIKTSDGSTVQGKVNIAPNQRVSDIFTLQKGPFIVMVDSAYSGGMGKTLFINKDHIIWVEPEEEDVTEF